MSGNEMLSLDDSDSSDPSIPDTDSEPEIPEDDEPTQSHTSLQSQVCETTQQTVVLQYYIYPCLIIIW